MKKIYSLIVVLVGLLLSLSCGANDPRHIIIMDGGSSSTKAYVFSYTEGQSYPALKLHSKVTFKPPVTDPTFFADPVAYFDSVLTMLDQAYPLTAQQRAQTSLFFMATAGVRSLSEADQNKTISAAQQGLQESATKHGYSIEEPITDHVRVISGSEEGLYGWLSSQYWNDHLRQDTLTAENTEPFMEMGGSSAQIAFLNSNAPQQYGISYYHKGIEYQPYVYSYVGFGNNEALSALLKQYQTLPACFPSGSQYPLDNPKFAGTGDFAQCRHAIEKAIYQEEPCSECSKMGVYQPKMAVDRATLTSGYYYTFDILGLARRRVNLDTLQQEGTKFCASSWNDLKKRHPNEAESTLIMHCFNAAWYDTVLRGFGLTNNSQVLATDMINDVKYSTDWATGAVWVWLNQ